MWKHWCADMTQNSIYNPNEREGPSIRLYSCTSRGEDEDETLQRQNNSGQRVLFLFNLCGVRGGGNATAQASFWQPKIRLSFVLAFESERERNAAIMLPRRFAFDCNIMLGGPDDRAIHNLCFIHLNSNKNAATLMTQQIIGIGRKAGRMSRQSSLPHTV